MAFITPKQQESAVDVAQFENRETGFIFSSKNYEYAHEGSQEH